jgi:hypothetical protein
MSHERKNALSLRGRELPNRGADHWQTTSLVVHKTAGNHCLVSLIVTDRQGNKCKDTRLGECWIVALDRVGRPLSPVHMLHAALEKLLTQPGSRLLPETPDITA